jgi:hypothetical protein
MATGFFAEPVAIGVTVKLVDLPCSSVPELAEACKVKSLPELPELAADPHSLTISEALTDPRPVARLYVAPEAVKPVTPGTLLFPEGVG